MTKKVAEISDDEMTDLVLRVAKPSFKFLMRKLDKELYYLTSKHEIKMIDFVNLILCSLSNIDSNILLWLRNCYKKRMNKEMDLSVLMHAYMTNLMSIMNEDEVIRLKQKLN